MDKSGRMCDILFEDEKMPHGYMTIYADAGMKETIVSMEGVRTCYKNCDEFTYHAYLDPRYDPQFVKANIRIAVTGGSKPAPELDVKKVRALISDISNEAYKWGFRSGRRFEATGISTGALHNRLEVEAKVNCGNARIALKKLLGIEES